MVKQAVYIQVKCEGDWAVVESKCRRNSPSPTRIGRLIGLSWEMSFVLSHLNTSLVAILKWSTHHPLHHLLQTWLCLRLRVCVCVCVGVACKMCAYWTVGRNETPKAVDLPMTKQLRLRFGPPVTTARCAGKAPQEIGRIAGSSWNGVFTRQLNKWPHNSTNKPTTSSVLFLLQSTAEAFINPISEKFCASGRLRGRVGGGSDKLPYSCSPYPPSQRLQGLIFIHHHSITLPHIRFSQIIIFSDYSCVQV